MSTIRVKAAVIDTRKLILYKEDGTTVSIMQGDPRMKTLVDAVMPIIKLGGIAELDLMIVNQYKDFEQVQEQTGGSVVRFFRTAKNKLGGLFRTEEAEEIEPGVYGEIPIADNLNEAIDEIIAHATPVTAEDFSPSDNQAEDTMIAVVENAEGERTVIPGVESLKDIIEHSAKNRHTIGVQNLLKRMAGYIKERAHSVEDLLRFLEKGDLPIADDGSIIAYKRLYTRKDEENGEYFVDPHTQKVRQKVGSKVMVAEALVDKNRRNECSNGLHIGRRAYMGSFSGNVMVLCKIAPEDVIVVPHNDPNKVRVCAYHILARLPDKAFRQISDNRPMTEIEGISELLGKVLKGNHVDVLETVEITEQKGGGLVITPTGAVRAKGANKKKEAHPAATAIDDKRNRRPEQQPSTVDVVEVANQVVGSRQQRARQLLDIVDTSKDPQHVWQAAKDLMAFKKKVKISWDRLGLTNFDAQKVAKIANNPPAKPVQKSVPKPKVPPGSKPLTKSERARMMRDQLFGHAGLDNRAQQAIVARQLLDFRRAAKKSWEALGCPDLNDEDLKQLINAAPMDVPHTQPDKATTSLIPPGTKVRTVKTGKSVEYEAGTPVKVTSKPVPGTPGWDEKELFALQKKALALVRGGATVSAASKQTGIHRRSIDRLIKRFGK